MFYAILWCIVGAYFGYLGIEILFLHKTNKLQSLKEKKFKNPEGFARRYGLIELCMGIIIIISGIIIGVLNNPTILTYTIGQKEVNISANYLMVALALIFILLIFLNEKLSKKE